jgi:hypothetical protein
VAAGSLLQLAALLNVFLLTFYRTKDLRWLAHDSIEPKGKPRGVGYYHVRVGIAISA